MPVKELKITPTEREPFSRYGKWASERPGQKMRLTWVEAPPYWIFEEDEDRYQGLDSRDELAVYWDIDDVFAGISKIVEPGIEHLPSSGDDDADHKAAKSLFASLNEQVEPLVCRFIEDLNVFHGGDGVVAEPSGEALSAKWIAWLLVDYALWHKYRRTTMEK
jgi:hypothetical protein